MVDILIPHNRQNVIFDSQILSTLMGCERLTNFRFNMHLIGKNGARPNFLTKGLLIHKMLEIYYKSRMAGLERKQCIIASVVEGEKFAIAECQTLDADTIQHVFAVMRLYYDYYFNEFWTPIHVEKVLSKIVYEDDEVRVMWKAKLDLFVDTNQYMAPVDHKSFTRSGDTLSLNNQFMGQCLVTETNRAVVDKIGLHLLDTKSPIELNKRFLRPVLYYSDDRLREQRQIIGYYAKYWLSLVANQYYPPRYTHCDKWSGCMFKSVCEQDRFLREEELQRFFEIGEPWDPSEME